eukprot:CAMPEP_0178419206 /NCGR_PEP_ID=MMETSP0689_2-20121128/25489_1 /TAXON_ID=160604 /ORGANISM="Amphidinium massartii, Strain CS-259" /LENGTH=140 /DNA_ID=CAMNT_0020040633 /DNA_START=872 /DNA_END=1294 /DNA_ORIENTATION=-
MEDTPAIVSSVLILTSLACSRKRTASDKPRILPTAAALLRATDPAVGSTRRLCHATSAEVVGGADGDGVAQVSELRLLLLPFKESLLSDSCGGRGACGVAEAKAAVAVATAVEAAAEDDDAAAVAVACRGGADAEALTAF